MRGRALLLAVLLLVLAVAPAGADGGFQRYTTPFAPGPTAGDQWNLTQADGESGRITVLRAYPGPTVLSCPGLSGMATFRVETAPVDDGRVHLTWSDAAIDSYTFITLTVRDEEGTYLAAGEVRGPVIGGDRLTVDLPAAEPEDDPRALTIDFGVKVASACPTVDGGTVVFESLEVAS